MNRVPYKISKSTIGPMDIIDKISTHITPAVFENTYKIPLKLNLKSLDHIMNLMWIETEEKFPGYVHCKCNSSCIRKFKVSYLLRSYKRHRHVNSERSEKIKTKIRNKMSTYYMSLMEIVGDPLVTKINHLY